MELPPTAKAHFEKPPGCQNAEHAERNAIAFAARCGIMLESSEITCTHAPCLACARAIINAGVTMVTYSIPYRLTEGIELLKRAGIQVIHMTAQ
jgi:dCMP deaminase